MEVLKKNLIDEAIEKASKLAETAPSKYQQSVFHSIFTLLLSNGLSSKLAQPTNPNSTSRSEPATSNDDILSLKFDWSSTKIPYLKGITQYLAIMEIALNKFNIDGLSARTIQQVLFEKFRVSKTANAVSMSLMNSMGKYVDRDEKNSEYIYRITRNGIELVRQEEASVKDA